MIALTVGLGYAAAAGLLAAAAATRRSPVGGRLGLAGPTRADPLGAIGGRLPWTPSGLRERLEILGRSEDLDRFRGAAVSCAVLGLLLGSLLGAPSPTALVAGAIAGAAGWRAPGFALARQAAGVRESMRAEVPVLLELLAVGLTAGLTPRLALDRAVDHIRDPLADPLRGAGREVTLGAAWPALLEDLGRRSQIQDLRRLASVLDRSLRLGAPAAEPVRALARDVRAERESALESRARRAPVTMLFPLVLCILPAFVLAAVVPAMLVATQGVP